MCVNAFLLKCFMCYFISSYCDKDVFYSNNIVITFILVGTD